MDKLMMLVLTIGPTIICWKILKSVFTSFASGVSQKMLFGKVPLLGGKQDPVSKVMPSLAGPISNPDVVPNMKDVMPTGEGKAPKMNIPPITNGETATPPTAGGASANANTAGGGAGVGVVVGVVNAIGAMPQTGRIRNLSGLTITGFMPQRGMIYNRALRFGNIQQVGNQIVNQMHGGRLTMNQKGNSQGTFTTKNIKVLSASGTSTYHARRIRTISGVNGSSMYSLGEGIRSVRGTRGQSTYHLARGIRRIKGVRGTSTYHSFEGIKKIKEVSGTSTYQISEGINKIKGITGATTIGIQGQVLKLKAPNSTNTIVKAKLSRSLRRHGHGEVLTAPVGTLNSVAMINGGSNIGLAVNDFYMPKINYNVNAMKMKLNETRAVFADPRNSGLTSTQKNKLVEINRAAQEDNRFSNLGERERLGTQDLFRYAARNYTDLNSKEILDLTEAAGKLDRAQSRKERALIAAEHNRNDKSRDVARKQLDKMLEDTTTAGSFSQYIDSNLGNVVAETGNKEEVEKQLKEDMLDDSTLMETVIGPKATEKVTKAFNDEKKKTNDQINADINKGEMAKDMAYRSQEAKNGNMSLAEARRQRVQQTRQGYFDQAVAERYPGYANNNPTTGNYNRQPYISYQPRT